MHHELSMVATLIWAPPLDPDSLKHIYTEKPWKDEGYNQTCQQEIAEWLAPLISSPLRQIAATAANSCNHPVIPHLHESAVAHTSNVFGRFTTNLTPPISASKEEQRDISQKSMLQMVCLCQKIYRQIFHKIYN